VFATSQRRTYNEYRACAPRVPGVGSSLLAHVRRPSGVYKLYIYASSSAHNFVHAQKNPTHQANDHKWSSALDEQVTNDDEQRRTNHFSVRSSCVLRASTRCDRAFPFAFDTVRHSTLLRRLACWTTDHVYNWIVDFFREHSPTKGNSTSSSAANSAGVKSESARRDDDSIFQPRSMCIVQGVTSNCSQMLYALRVLRK